MKLCAILSETMNVSDPFIRPKPTHDVSEVQYMHEKDVIRNLNLAAHRVDRLYKKINDYAATVDSEVDWLANFDVEGIEVKACRQHPSMTVYVPDGDQNPVYKHTLKHLIKDHNRCVDMFNKYGKLWSLNQEEWAQQRYYDKAVGSKHY